MNSNLLAWISIKSDDRNQNFAFLLSIIWMKMWVWERAYSMFVLHMDVLDKLWLKYSFVFTANASFFNHIMVREEQNISNWILDESGCFTLRSTRTFFLESGVHLVFIYSAFQNSRTLKILSWETSYRSTYSKWRFTYMFYVYALWKTRGIYSTFIFWMF